MNEIDITNFNKLLISSEKQITVPSKMQIQLMIISNSHVKANLKQYICSQFDNRTLNKEP